MVHLHLLGLLTFEILVLLASFFFMAFVNKQGLEKKFQTAGKAITITMHVIIVATILHAIIHHFMGHGEMGMDHMEMMKQIHGGGMH